jgi:hypothetical protein
MRAVYAAHFRRVHLNPSGIFNSAGALAVRMPYVSMPLGRSSPNRICLKIAYARDSSEFHRSRPRLLLMARRGPNGSGKACLLRPGSSDVNLFRNGEGVIDLDTEVPDSAFDLGVTEQELHGSQVAGTSVDQGCLGPS